MKPITGLYIIIALMHFITLTNITLFNGKWTGIAMWLSTCLFIAGTVLFLMNKKKKASQ